MVAVYPPSREQFDGRPWDEIVVAAKHKTCTDYCTAFCARTASEVDPGKRSVWKFLANVTSDSLELGLPNGEFEETVADYSDEEIDLLKALVADVEDHELKARMADIVWRHNRKGTFRFAEIATRSYLESAKVLEDPENWTYCADRVERALKLAVVLNRPHLERLVIAYIEDVIRRCNGEDPLYLSLRMMALLLERKAGEPATYAPLAAKLARNAEQKEDYHRAREYWRIKARWDQRAGDVESARQAEIAAAETHVKLSQKALERTGAPYLHSAGHLSSAIEAYRRIGGTQERVEELHKELLRHQEKSVSEYGQFTSNPVDVTEIAEEAQRRVKDRPLQEALVALSTLLNPTSVARVKKDVEQHAARHPLLALFGSQRTNALGRVVARQPSVLADSAEEVAEGLMARMYESAAVSWQMNAVSIIEPARRQIVAEHSARVSDFLKLVSDNPFVPSGREAIYARGLHAGLIGDFMTALHLLVPQIEQSIRCLLYNSGAIVSGINSTGIQYSLDLNTTLKDSRYVPILNRLFGEDTVFDLRGLLVEANGAYLRNEMAHGLLDATDCDVGAVRYLWWLTLRLCCIPIIQRCLAAAADRSAERQSACEPSGGDSVQSDGPSP